MGVLFHKPGPARITNLPPSLPGETPFQKALPGGRRGPSPLAPRRGHSCRRQRTAAGRCSQAVAGGWTARSRWLDAAVGCSAGGRANPIGLGRWGRGRPTWLLRWRLLFDYYYLITHSSRFRGLESSFRVWGQSANHTGTLARAHPACVAVARAGQARSLSGAHSVQYRLQRVLRGALPCGGRGREEGEAGLFHALQTHPRRIAASCRPVRPPSAVLSRFLVIFAAAFSSRRDFAPAVLPACEGIGALLGDGTGRRADRISIGQESVHAPFELMGGPRVAMKIASTAAH